MHRSEADQTDVCADCGAEVSLVGERLYVVGPNAYICGACAERRGGVYDEGRDEWEPTPDVRDMAETAEH